MTCVMIFVWWMLISHIYLLSFEYLSLCFVSTLGPQGYRKSPPSLYLIQNVSVIFQTILIL